MRIYPAIRAQMGDWQYYIVRMKMREIAHEVQFAHDIYEDKTLSDAVQRVLLEKRVKTEIAQYLARRPDRFFSSIVVAAMEGEPVWSPVEMDENVVPKVLTTSSSLRDSFGVLSFGDEPKYYALDGQHRVAAIKLLIDRETDIQVPKGFDDDFLSVIVVLREEHDVPEGEWMRRYRRLFSSLNRYAKPTDKDTNIIMDEDDLFAIITRRLITEHDFFKAPGIERKSFRVLTKGKNLKSGTSHFTTLQTLYAVNTKLLKSRERDNLGWRHGNGEENLNVQIRPDEEFLDRYYDELVNYWDAILKVLPVLREDPEKMRIHNIQKDDSEQCCDHLLFWPIGQELFSEIVRLLLDDAELGDDAKVPEIVAALQPLAKVPWNLHEVPWRYLLLIPKSSSEDEPWRMRSEDRKLALTTANHILQWIVGRYPLDEDQKEELRKKWQGLLIWPPSDEGAIDELWREIEEIRARIVTDSE